MDIREFIAEKIKANEQIDAFEALEHVDPEFVAEHPLAARAWIGQLEREALDQI